jgi:colicin import membrane protein
MRQIISLFIGLCLTCSVFAQSAQVTTDAPTAQERQAEGQRLSGLRQKLDDDYQQEVKACYQFFDVTRCRIEARERRIHANAALRKEELRYNASERRIQAVEAIERTEEKNSDAKLKEAEAQRAQAVQAHIDRADANAQKQLEHELQGTKRGEYEQRQREAAQHRADVEKKMRERTKEPAAPLPVPGR